MRVTWLELVDKILRPSRPDLERCVREREHHLVARRQFAEERTRAIAKCVRRIESARAAVFLANDGVISSRMTELEREWRLLSRQDPDRGSMDLWARIAPPSWIDRKRWRDADPSGRVEAAVMLAADVAGVEAAETAAFALRDVLVPWGVPIGARIRWRPFDGNAAADADNATKLLAEPLRAAREALSAPVVLSRAHRLEDEVCHAADLRFPERPRLARAIAHAAFVETVWHGSTLCHPVPAHPAHSADPVAPLRQLWETGYILAGFDASSVTLAFPDTLDESFKNAQTA